MLNKLKMSTPDLTDKNIEQIGTLFPNVITEVEDGTTKDTKGHEIKKYKKVVDFDLLRQMLSKDLVEGSDERYRLDWPGKKASLLKANTPITKTLRPCREESVNFDTTENLYIEGDNFEVLKILQESYLGKIKMIYIDPPYNTGNDFIYKDNFAKSKDEYEEELGTTDEEGGRLFRNTDSNGRYHSDWLSMMSARLVIARDLLKEDGVIAISIDGGELYNLLKICNELFGESNFVNIVTVKSATTASFRSINVCPVNVTEFIVIYRKSEKLTFTTVYTPVDYSEDYSHIIENFDLSDINQWVVRSLDDLVHKEEGVETWQEYKRIKGDNWKQIRFARKREISFSEKHRVVSLNTLQKPSDAVQAVIDKSKKNRGIFYRIDRENNTPIFVYNGRTLAFFGAKFKDFGGIERPAEVLTNFWGDISYLSLGKEGDVPFPNGKKPLALIQRLIEIFTFNDDIVLDFFSGSATTAHSVLNINFDSSTKRKFVLVQLPENLDESLERAVDQTTKKQLKAAISFLDSIDKPHIITEIGKERIRRAGKKIVEELKSKNEQLKFDEVPVDPNKLDIGFRVYKTDSTNMKDVFYHPSELKQDQLDLLESNIKEDRTPEDLLTQVILDLGLELTLPIETKKILGNTVFIVQTNALVACFDNDIDFKIVDTISDLKPLKVVFKDASFKDDKDRINVEERFKRLSPETKVTVI